MTYTSRRDRGNRAWATTAALLAWIASFAHAGSAHAQLPQSCRDAINEVADSSKGFLCTKVKANACHQTSTRLASVFLGDPKAVGAKVELASFEAIYKDICGAEYAVAPKGTCSPKSSSVYQMLYDDTNAGHSFLVACMKDKGCVVLQAVAGAFKLKDWVTGTSDTLMKPVQEAGKWIVRGNKLPDAPDKFGKIKVLNNADLYEWLSLADGFVRDDGTVKSFRAFWVCDDNAKCQTLMDQNGLKPPADKVWDTKLTRVNGARIIASKFGWKETCLKVDDVRQYGVAYPSPYCSLPGKPTAVCTMGLGMKPAWFEDALGLPNDPST